MLRTRVIPCLQLLKENLVKTVKFKNPGYIGDFVNTARIFNELEVDEMCILGIRNTKDGRLPDFKVLEQIADECFMPLSYGGGINDFETGKKILALGYEKLVINSATFSKPHLITEISEHFGAQSVIGSMDVKKNTWGKQYVYSVSGSSKQKISPIEWAQKLEELGAGELLVTSIDQEGTWLGYDIDLIEKISSAVQIPVIAHGGAGNLDHISSVVNNANASAVGLGSMVVYQKKGMGVLVNFPDRSDLLQALKSR